MGPSSSSSYFSRSATRSFVSLIAIANVARVAAVQPAKPGRANTFEVVGNSGISAQQMFLGTSNKVIKPHKLNG